MPLKKIIENKTITVNEDVELNMSKPSVFRYCKVGCNFV